MYDATIFIGRFEPVHCGHVTLLRHALDHAPRTIVVVGSAWQARTPKNPFTWQEREAMLKAALPEADRDRVQVLPVRDCYNETLWAQTVHQGVTRLVGDTARIGLVGHLKDASSNYLRNFSDWELLHLERQGSMDASTIRDTYFSATPETVRSALAPLATEIPPSTLQALDQFAQTPDYLSVQEEWRILRNYRAAWAKAPYPPVFVTVDALLRCQGHVLLIRRGKAPGKGLWALPGGFLEPHDTLWQACLRELAEETHCPLPEPEARAALQQVVVFDHPGRSQRGRTITHVHHFDLNRDSLPAVRADDDAAEAHWVPQSELASLESEMFEDHFHILNQLLGLLDAPGG